jgi:hypothetical protein
MTPTPGPWAYDGVRVFAPAADEHVVRRVDGTDVPRGLIALVYAPSSDGSLDANAHLIASAPELVGCCRELLAVIDRHLDQESLAAVVARMRDVVAHAEGRTKVVPIPSGQPCGCDPAAGWTCERHRFPAVTS